MADHNRKAPSRVAIAIGNSTSSSSTHAVKQHSRPAFGKRHRANGGIREDASDSDNESGDDQDQKNDGRQETILTYGDDHDLSGKESNKNYKSDSRQHRSQHYYRDDDDKRRKRYSEDRSPDRRDKREEKRERDRCDRSPDRKAGEQEEDKKPVKWGLTINMKGAKAGNRDRDGNFRSKSRGQSDGDRSGSEEKDHKPETKKSIDDEALDALMGNTAAPKKRKLDDVDVAPDREPQAEDYQAVPIDDFGASLLRGMGWDGKMRGEVREVKRHANLTGLGAKDVKGNEDLGAWNPKGIVKKDSRPVRLNEYRKEEDKKRQRLEDRRGDNSYRRELERERERDRGRNR